MPNVRIGYNQRITECVTAEIEVPQHIIDCGEDAVEEFVRDNEDLIWITDKSFVNVEEDMMFLEILDDLSTKEQVDWDYWRKHMKAHRPDLEEDFDEAEGDFLGWRYKDTGRCMTPDVFAEYRRGVNHGG